MIIDETRAFRSAERAAKQYGNHSYSSNTSTSEGCGMVIIMAVFIGSVIVVGNTSIGDYLKQGISRLFTTLVNIFGVTPIAITLGMTTLPLGYIFFKIREHQRKIYGYLEISFSICSAIFTIGERNHWTSFAGTNNSDLVVYVVLFTSIYIAVRGFDNIQQGKKQQKECSRLLKAAQDNDLDAVKYLVESGVDINCRSNEGLTPLMLAAEKNNIDIVNLLIKKGAYINIKTADGMTAQKIAEKNGYNELAELLGASKVSV